MRQRVIRVALVASAVALVLLALPLAVAIRSSLFTDERAELERDAMAAVVRVGPDFAAGDPVELPRGQGEGRVGAYDAQGRLRAGSGPDPADPATRSAAAGRVVRAQAGGELVVAVPVAQDERVIGVVRAAAPTRTVWMRVLVGWAALLGACLLALGAAVLTARRQASALSAPLESLSRTSRAVADGDLTARAAVSGIAEIDEVARAHNAMVERLAQLLRRERDFTANASHQLRTPLTGLQLGLEAALMNPGADPRAALAEALEQSQHLDRTIDEVLRLATSGSGPAAPPAAQPVGELLEAAERRWHGPLAKDGRRLVLAYEQAAAALPVPGRTTDQILDVLLGNAHRHGAGTVTVTLRDLGSALALDVADEGTHALDPKAVFERGASTGPGPGSGIGLALARELAGAAGARLALSGTAPTRFTLLLPRSGPA